MGRNAGRIGRNTQLLFTFAILGVAVPIRAQNLARLPFRGDLPAQGIAPKTPAVCAVGPHMPIDCEPGFAPGYDAKTCKTGCVPLGHDSERAEGSLAGTEGASRSLTVAEGRTFPLTREEKAAQDAAVEHKLDETILAGIGFSRERGLDVVEVRLRRLMKEGTLPEKAEYVGAAGKVYRFPSRLEASTSGDFRVATGDLPCRATSCKSSHSEEVCNNRTICRMVCQGAAGAIGGAIGGGVGGAIGGIGSGGGCQQVCENVPECRTTLVCDEYNWSGPGCF